jgi:NTP pyrophosphatase (non-canonical NTP hydrolase)
MIREFETSKEEIVTILAEECAELIQEIMKMKRKNNYASSPFMNEVADVLLMIELAKQAGLISEEQLAIRTAFKRNKLKQWSNLFNL